MQQAAGGSLFGLVGPAVSSWTICRAKRPVKTEWCHRDSKEKSFSRDFLKEENVGQQDEGPGGFHAEIGDCFRRPRHLQLEAEHYGI